MFQRFQLRDREYSSRNQTAVSLFHVSLHLLPSGFSHYWHWEQVEIKITAIVHHQESE